MQIKPGFILEDNLAKFIFLILPTFLIGYHAIHQINVSYSLMQNSAYLQSAYLFAGIISGFIFSIFRLRFWIGTTTLVLILLFLYKGIDQNSSGEFDTFYLSIHFYIFSIIFSFGWIIGFGFQRWRWFHYFVSGLFLIIGLSFATKQLIIDNNSFWYTLTPILVFSIYIIFCGQYIQNHQQKGFRFWMKLIIRLLILLISLFLIKKIANFYFEKNINEAIQQSQQQSHSNEDGMLNKNKDGTFDLKDYAQLKSNQGRSNELLFAAHINYFFEDSDIPNPLYLTAFYYTKFDTSTETFEKDIKIPNNDLFEPDVSKVPLYNTLVDSTVLKQTLNDKGRKVVDIEIYNKKLSKSTYLSPHIGFFVQPISIDKDYKDQFISAYRAKGYISELNSAYFIYNAQDPQIKIFQDQRFSVLRKAREDQKMDSIFKAYYTNMPNDIKFKQISKLSDSITKGASTTIDKVLRIRDFFLATDELGNRIFSYTDNPGVPDIPSASKLMNFIFENHKGYCAYYAGATLFLLRAAGIPSRIAVGFMTVDRSDKNKGWYWYYADQAHAWVQVYFPGFGWIDFDTTVGDDDAQESPTPDGTPPMQPPNAIFVSTGIVTNVDTSKALMYLNTNQILFKDKPYLSDSSIVVSINSSASSIRIDTNIIGLKDIMVGDTATVLSFGEDLKKIIALPTIKNLNQLIPKLPHVIHADDIIIKPKQPSNQEQHSNIENNANSNSYKLLLVYSLIIVSLISLFIASPYLLLHYYTLRIRYAKNNKNWMFWHNKRIEYYLHMLDVEKLNQTSLQFAQNTIDPKFKTNWRKFIETFLQMKYMPSDIDELTKSNLFKVINDTLIKVNQEYTKTKKLKSFLRPLKMISYLNNQ